MRQFMRMRFIKCRSVFSFTTISFFLLLGTLFASTAWAAPPVENTGCILDQPGNNGVNCNSNDVALSSPVITVVEPCDYPGDTAKLQVIVDVTVTANTRYDVGVWLSVDGDPNNDGSASGICSVLSINPTTLQTDGVAADFDGDQCGDVQDTGNAVDIANTDLGTVDLLCNDSDGDGFINVPVITSWKQSAGAACTVSNEAWPGTSPKCTDNRELNLPVPIPGRIIINKDAIPDSAQSFAFNISGPDSGIVGGFTGSYDFSLTDDGITPANATFDSGDGTLIGGLPAGAYSVTETVPTGWLQTSAVCVSDVDGLNTDPSAIDLRASETVTCDFTNEPDTATINVVKKTVGGNGVFSFGWFGPTTSDAFALDTGVINTATETIVTTETGTFTLIEAIPAGWALGNAACFDDNGGAGVGTWDNIDTINGIDLVPGQSVTCTFTNQAIGTIMLVKNTQGGDGSFDFVTDVPGLGTNIQTSGGSGSATPASNVPAGTYSIIETVPAGWNLDSATCSDGSSPDSLVLTLGETVTCTFTNTKLGTVIVEKQTLPDGSTQAFDFTGNVAGTIADGGQITLPNLLPGTYSSTETVPASWDLTSIVCDDGGSDTPSSGNVNNGTATFNLDAGETVTCVFTNTQDGSIEVIKSVPITGPLVETFGFTSNFNGNFNLVGDAATTGPVLVTPGSGYTVSEDDPSLDGWANTGASCGDGSDPLTDIVVSPGEAVVCTFTNTPLGSAVIIKDTVGGNGTFGFTGDAPIGPFSLDTTTLFTATTGDLFDYILSAGIYDVTEDDIPTGFELTGIICDDGSSTDLDTATASMDVQLAETVSCTFTNTADGTLIIRKETIPDGAAQGFDFTGDATGNIHDYSATAEEIVVSGQPGTYTSAETVPAGWAITDISCTGDVQSGVTIGANNVSVDLAAGETVICTFENSLQGSVTIEKFTQGGLGGFQFNSDLGQFLLDTLNNGNPDAATFSDLSSSTYMFSEVVPSNWTLSHIQCSGATTSIITIGGAGGFDPGDQGVTIELNNGENITCTFVNDAHGGITVTKITDPTGSPQSFDFTGDITASLTDGQSSTTIMVPAGSYAVSETAVAGWDLTDISCDDDDSAGAGDTANFVVASGEGVTCTFTNTQHSHILVDKVTDPFGSTESFDFTSSYGNPFSLTDAAPANDSGPLSPGQYSVAETVKSGWDLTTATCSDGSAPDAIALAAGETVTCTFTNTIQRSRIVVDKVTDPAGSTQSFAFVTNYGALGFNLTDAAIPNDSGDLLPSSEFGGTYSVVESPIAGWTETSAVCTGDVGGAKTPGAIDLLPDETVTCTFTNTIQQGQIVVDKQTAPTGAAQLFDFTLTGTGVNQPFQLADATPPHNSGDLLPTSENGTYNVGETVPTDWTQISATCSDGSSPAAVNLSPGEVVTCTFVNSEAGNSTLSKVSIGGDATFSFTSDTPAGNFSLTTVNGISPVLPIAGLDAGTYFITESALAGWDLTGLVCIESGIQDSTTDIPTRTITLRVEEGETISCTVTNTKQGSITVSKVTVPSGDPAQFAFTGDASGSMGDGGTIVVSNLAPGSYTSVESALAGWDLTGIQCDDGTSTTPSSGDVGTLTATFNLDAGEDVICTFTNTLRADINLAKTVVGTAVMEANGTYTVVYTVTATNTGGPGMYDLLDTFSPGSGITLNTATATYLAGSEDSQTGTLGAYPNFVTNEGLAAGLNESWSVTANFTINPVLVDPVNSQCDPSAPAINTGFYNAVRGSDTDPDLSDNETCTSLPAPVINLAKTAAPAVDVGGGIWQVVYTITATNSGQGPGVYDITDTMSPGTGITPVIDATYPGLVYAGGETQTGTLTAPPLANGGTWITDEGLAAGASESWTVTANFTVDPATLDPATTSCDSAAPVINTGFYNAVSGSATDVDPSDDQTCTGLSFATLTVMKQVNGGSALPSDFVLTLTGADGVNDGGVDYMSGDQPPVKVGIEYLLTETPDQVPNYLDGGVSCTDNAGNTPVPYPVTLTAGQSVTCTQVNNFRGEPVDVIAVPVNDKLALLLLTLMLLASGWYFRPATMRK